MAALPTPDGKPHTAGLRARPFPPGLLFFPAPRGGAAAAPGGARGRFLNARYVYFFQAAGMVLLVAMVGAIVLTLRHKEGVKRQSIAAQVARGPATAIEVRKVETGKGI